MKLTFVVDVSSANGWKYNGGSGQMGVWGLEGGINNVLIRICCRIELDSSRVIAGEKLSSTEVRYGKEHLGRTATP